MLAVAAVTARAVGVVVAVTAVAVPVAQRAVAVAGGDGSGRGGEGGGSEGSGSEGDWGRKRPQTCTRPHVVPIMLANQPTERPAPTAFLKTMSLSAAQSSAPSAKTMPASMQMVAAATHLPGAVLAASKYTTNDSEIAQSRGTHTRAARAQSGRRWGRPKGRALARTHATLASVRSRVLSPHSALPQPQSRSGDAASVTSTTRGGSLAWLEAAMAIICSQPSISELQSKSDTLRSSRSA